MSARVLSVLCLAFLLLLGSPEPGHAQSGAAMTLRPGDVLRIDVWPLKELSGEFTIEETGLVYLPLLEAVQAGGVSLDALRADLRRRYGEAGRNPVVTITPLFRVTVTGAVQRPGVHIISPTHSLLDVIALAGGFQGSADTEKVQLVRPGGVVTFDALRVLETGEGMDAVQLRSGDHIVVPALRQPWLTWRNAFEAVRTISTLVLLFDRLGGS